MDSPLIDFGGAYSHDVIISFMDFHLELYFNFRQANMRLQNEDGINTKDV